MAQLAPLRGLHYNGIKVPDPEAVVTPPYDVIGPKEREVYAARHPQNMVHLILPQPQPGDNLIKNRYTRAAALFSQWRREEILIRAPEPAFYYWETIFTLEGRRHTRRGLAGLVRLEPFSAGVVRPHEQTFSAIKADRLELLKHAEAQFSPIFSLYPDPDDRVMALLQGASPAEPMMDFNGPEGHEERIFRVTDPACLKEVCLTLKDAPIYIADGHHRYETALAYRKWISQQYPQASPQAAFNYILMYLANLHDPDLVILPAHRLLKGPRLKHVEEAPLLQHLKTYFEVEPLPAPAGPGDVYGEFLEQTLKEGRPRGSVFVMAGFGGKTWLLTLKPGVAGAILGRQMNPALARLDVVVLNYLIFEKILRLDSTAQDDKETCQYTSRIPEALAALNRGEVQLAFLLNPTLIDQVQGVATAGLIMPRKSTYFYPKVITGVVLNPVDRREEIISPC